MNTEVGVSTGTLEYGGAHASVGTHGRLAEALVFASLYEGFGLPPLEAMAVGTPVIAYPSGALTDIVEDGVTGFLVNNVDEMAAAIRRVHEISPAACRATAERRFSRDRMVREYFDLYAAMVRREQVAIPA